MTDGNVSFFFELVFCSLFYFILSLLVFFWGGCLHVLNMVIFRVISSHFLPLYRHFFLNLEILVVIQVSTIQCKILHFKNENFEFCYRQNNFYSYFLQIKNVLASKFSYKTIKVFVVLCF